MTTTNPPACTAAHAASLVAHVKIDPPRTLDSVDHSSIPEDEEFVAVSALWSWRTEDSLSIVSLHSEGGTYCLAYYPGDVLPEWLPRPPAEWGAAAAAFIATVKAAR